MERIMLLLTDTTCMLSKKNVVSGSLILKKGVIQCWKKFCLVLLGERGRREEKKIRYPFDIFSFCLYLSDALQFSA